MDDAASTPTEIERKIAAERGALAETLEIILASVAPDKIAGTLADTVQREGGAVIDIARRNPGALALMGLGAAWMAANAARITPETVVYDDRPTETVRGFPGDGTLPTQGVDARIASADLASRGGVVPTAPAQKKPRASAAQMRRALDRGLDQLPPAARKRVRDARKAAISAQEKLEARAKQTAADLERLAYRNPLAVGGMSAAIGALVGAVLPGSEAEDRLLGAQSDLLMREAEAALRDEMTHAREMSEAALRDGLDAGQERVRGALHG